MNDFKSEDLTSIALKSKVSILTLAFIIPAALTNVGPTMLIKIKYHPLKNDNLPFKCVLPFEIGFTFSRCH